ncbi:hypothetical protein [Deinococcus sp. Marseille-Q6407]|uniref:hypothetical protein n=1 Tax=Deinococcus sp. Marseille-Q6407 TaxID=2969223 RepID=UPI0021C15D97|nr:hypothetical protein [Deinococcus sp. Marseille-Q6407]
MTYAQTREEYRQALMHDICKLVQMIEADHDDGAVWLAQSIHHDTRSYFDRDRWKPQPVAAGIMAHVPKDQPVTLVIQHHTYHDGGRQVVRGKVEEMHAAYKPDDGAQFSVIPQRCRNPRHYQYKHQRTSSLTVYAGYLSDAELSSGRHKPIFYSEHPDRDEQAAD